MAQGDRGARKDIRQRRALQKLGYNPSSALDPVIEEILSRVTLTQGSPTGSLNTGAFRAIVTAITAARSGFLDRGHKKINESEIRARSWMGF